jgi:hypothetical protein
MSTRWSELRDELITKARYGKITPQEAEAEAKAAGLSPFETQPDFAEFDPMAESRWPIVMAVAWIAWRDPQLVMEQGNEFRGLCTQWVFRDWTEPDQSGQNLAKHEGWVLEPWHKSSALGLSILDKFLRGNGQLPPSARVTPSQAETELWRALSEERLRAEAFDKDGTLVEIPAREWAHLILVQEREQDALKYDVLDRDEPYSKVRFRRSDLINLWPRYKPVDIGSLDWGQVTDLHLEPMTRRVH